MNIIGLYSWESDSEWLSLTSFLWLQVHVIHIKPYDHKLYTGIIIFTHIDNHNLQVTINLRKKKWIKKKHKSEGTLSLETATIDQFTMTLTHN